MLCSVGAFPPELTHSVDYHHYERDHDEADDHVAGIAEGLVELGPLAAERVADAGQRDDVDQRADQVEDPEPHRRDLHDPGHDRREGSDEREHARDRQRPRAPAHEEPLGPVHVALGDQDVPAPAVHQRPSAGPAHPVGDERADHLGRGSQDDDQDEARVAARGHVPGGDRTAQQEREFGGDRDAHRLKHAEQDDGVDGV
jgi:hypothetical protein